MREQKVVDAITQLTKLIDLATDVRTYLINSRRDDPYVSITADQITWDLCHVGYIVYHAIDILQENDRAHVPLTLARFSRASGCDYADRATIV